jgi:surface carbohydrate biosynthesis protein
MLIYLPIENYARELDGKILLSARLAKEGHTVVVGSSVLIRHLTYMLNCDIYLGKNMHFYATPYNETITTEFGFKKIKSWYFDFLKKRKVSTIYSVEEGDFSADQELTKKVLLNQCDPSIMSQDDYFATWGKIQEKIYKEQPTKYPLNIISAGNVRFDLYKNKNIYSKLSSSIREKYKKFILINTNYSLANNSGGLGGVFKENSVYSVHDDLLKETHALRWKQQQDRFSNMVVLIFSLSVKFKDINFIIRPHPSERESTYSTIFNNIPNIYIERKGSVGPWLEACEMLIHDGCTTGLEACLMNKAVISYSPLDPKLSLCCNERLSNIGIVENSIDNVVQRVGELMRKNFSISSICKLPSNMSSMVENLNKNSYSVDIFNDIVQKIFLYRKSKGMVRVDGDIGISKKNLIKLTAYFFKFFIIAKYSFILLRDRGFEKYRSMDAARYDIEYQNIDGIIQCIPDITKDEIKIQSITRDLFIVSNKI